MRHYALDQWVDFGRGLVGAEDGIQMLNHLAEGCTSCQREADFCARLTKVCQRLETRRVGTEKVPESVVRMAKAIFPFYRAGDCSVDVRIEPGLKPARAALIGQITNHVLPQAEMANIRVCLKSGRLLVAETLSNRFGEFQMEYEPQARLKLCITLQDGKIIRVPLNRFTSVKPVNAGRTSLRKRSAMGQQ
jgi:hypothetical protein